MFGNGLWIRAGMFFERVCLRQAFCFIVQGAIASTNILAAFSLMRGGLAMRSYELHFAGPLVLCGCEKIPFLKKIS